MYRKRERENLFYIFPFTRNLEMYLRNDTKVKNVLIVSKGTRFPHFCTKTCT